MVYCEQMEGGSVRGRSRENAARAPKGSFSREVGREGRKGNAFEKGRGGERGEVDKGDETEGSEFGAPTTAPEDGKGIQRREHFPLCSGVKS